MTNGAARVHGSWPALSLLLVVACQLSQRLGGPLAVVGQQSPPPATGPAIVVEPEMASTGPPPLPPPALAVQEFGPTGPIDVGAEPRVRFNQQVAPLGQAILADPGLRIVLDPKAVDVPVPAGLEPVLDNLGRGHGVSRLDSAGGRLTSHEERHPDRVLLFIDHLSAGEHHHTVALRAITPGEFALPPARAEAMYMPEIYGRTRGSRLTVTGLGR